MHNLQKNYLECVKTGRNCSKFTIDKYHMNAMEIIKLFLVNIFMPVTTFPRLTILLFCKKRSFRIFDQLGGFSKKLTVKIRYFALRKKGREKTRMIKVAKSCHQETWPQKNVTKKKRERELE